MVKTASQQPTPVKLAATTRRSNDVIIASFVLEVQILFFQSHFVFCHENGMEEWSAFHQYSHFKGKPSSPVSVLAAQPSLSQPLGGTSSPPCGSSSPRFCCFSKAISFSFMKLAWNVDTPLVLCCIRSAELSTPTRRNIITFLVIEFEIFMLIFKGKFFKGKFDFLSLENGMEAWLAFHQYLHLLLITSCNISVLLSRAYITADKTTDGDERTPIEASVKSVKKKGTQQPSTRIYALQ